MISLVGVAFDHSRGTDAPYTLPLRAGTVPLGVPEWTPATLAPSACAYVLDRLPAQAAVLARFAADVAAGTELQVRAVASTAQPPPAAPSLPDLPPVTVRFVGGDSGWCAVPLATAPLRAAGVGTGLTAWTWQARARPADAWTTVAETVHEVHAVLSVPTAPWDTAGGDGTLPELAALRIACAWATGARDADAAAARITTALNQLGSLRYDAVVGAPHYCLLGLPHFLLDAFVERVHGGPGAGPLVNCSDCATVVSTLANLLGADLWQSKMGLVGPGFAINPLLAIGSDAWSTLFGGFVFHEVAWTGDGGEADVVFDACARTDADDDPTRPPHRPSGLGGQVFGAVGSGGYRDRIATPAGRKLCVPQPGERVRRSVAADAIPAFRPLAAVTERATVARLKLDTGPAAGPAFFFDGFRWFGAELPGWGLSRVERRAAGGAAERTLVTSSWWQPDGGAGLLRVDSYEAPSSEAAGMLLPRLAAEIQSPALAPLERDRPGDVALAVPGGPLVLFARGNHVHVLRSAAAEPVDVVPEARRLDGWLTGGAPAGRRDRAGGVLTCDGGGAMRLRGSGVLPGTTAPAAPGWRRLLLTGADARREGDELVIAPRDATSTVQEELVTAATRAPSS